MSTRKSLKWYKKLFQHLLDVTVYNAFVLYKLKNPSTRLTLLTFRQELVNNIITKHHTGVRQFTGGCPSGSGDAPTRLTDRHFPSLIPPTASSEAPLRECRVCGASKRDGKRIRKQTRYMCATCGAVALCLVPCFKRYHTLTHYAYNFDDDSSDSD